MALIKSHTRFGITCENAYHRILRVVAERMTFVNDDGEAVVLPGAIITTGVWASAAAAADGVLPFDQLTVRARLDGDASGALIAQAYQLVKATPEYTGAQDA